MISSVLLLICLMSISQCNELIPSGLLQNVTFIAKLAKPGELPYQISLQTTITYFHFCGGTLITDVFIITAAHCVDGRKARKIIAVAGITSLFSTDNPNQNTRLVIQIIVHEKYDPRDSWRNNIALLKVSAFPRTRYIRPVDILTSDLFANMDSLQKSRNGVYPTVSGYGNLMKTGPMFGQLYKSRCYLMNRMYCKEIYEPIMHIFDTQICAYYSFRFNNLRVVDSGGPLVVDEKLIGIISRTPDNLHTDFPMVFTYVSSYSSWIDNLL